MSLSTRLNVSIHCVQHLDELNYQWNWKGHFCLICDFCQKSSSRLKGWTARILFFLAHMHLGGLDK